MRSVTAPSINLEANDEANLHVLTLPEGIMAPVGDPPLTHAEVEAWLGGLSATIAGRIMRLRDLLKHAAMDEMSVADRTLCVQSLAKLEAAATISPMDGRPASTMCYNCHLERHIGVSCDDALELDLQYAGRRVPPPHTTANRLESPNAAEV